MKKRLLCIAVLGLSSGAISALADSDRLTEQKIAAAVEVVDILFGDKERRVFTDYGYEYYDELESHQEGKKGKKAKSLPPGLKKKLERGGELPPGWQKKVARGEVIDADLYGQARPLPASVYSRLPAQPVGTELIQLEDRIVRIIHDTREVLDVFRLVAR